MIIVIPVKTGILHNYDEVKESLPENGSETLSLTQKRKGF